MAKLGWVGSVALAAGASAGAAAAQFGLGYGLGIISWTPLPSTGPRTTDSVWVSGLAWTAFIATTSTVVGAICADRRSAGDIGAAPPKLGGATSEAPGAFASSIWRVLLAVSAAVGALLSVALVLVPARAAVRPDTSTPQLIAGGYAIIGILAGILIAVFALVARAAATNVVATAGWLWVLAVASVIDGVLAGRGLGSAPLGVWPFNSDTHALIWSLPAGLSMLGAAFVIGAVVARIGMRRGDSWFGTSVSGAFGPILVMVAYDLTAPHLVGVSDSQMSAYWFAPQALVAGLFGSMLVSGIIHSRRNALAAARTAEFRAPSDPGRSVPGYPPVAAVGRARPMPRRRGSSDASPSDSGASEFSASEFSDSDSSDSETVPITVPTPATGDADSATTKKPAAVTASTDDTSTASSSTPRSSTSSGKRGRR